MINAVSSRVIEKARRQQNYLRNVEMVSGTAGSLNIELLISLLESSKVYGWVQKTELLKTLVERDIKAVLTPARLTRFHLHRGLLELHSHRRVSQVERVLGFISLNYDDVLDRAYTKYHGDPNYCFTLERNVGSSESVPLLKLHGSFNWSNRAIRGRRRTIGIIPLGSNKTYIHIPYGFIWSRALEILTECDTLRVIGCSLSPNDAHLIDLLFKAHIERARPFDIEIIAPISAGESIRSNYGFFPNIKTLLEIEGSLIPDRSPENPFKTWLKYKSIKMLTRTGIRRATFLKQIAG